MILRQGFNQDVRAGNQKKVEGKMQKGKQKKIKKVRRTEAMGETVSDSLCGMSYCTFLMPFILQESMMKKQEAQAFLSRIASGDIEQEKGHEKASGNVRDVFQTVFQGIEESFPSQVFSSAMHKKEKDKKVYCTERGCAADIDIEKAEERENKRKRVGKGGTTFQ